MTTQTRLLNFSPLLAAAVAALVAVAHAQQVAPPAAGAPAAAQPTPTEVRKDEVVQLSPFQVAADTDKGYQALNTLSGTRLNSKLEDLGASITVVTKQQMLDTAVLDLNDVFRYEASTEGTANFTTFNRNRSGGINDQVASNPQQSNRIRGVS